MLLECSLCRVGDVPNLMCQMLSLLIQARYKTGPHNVHTSCLAVVVVVFFLKGVY